MIRSLSERIWFKPACVVLAMAGFAMLWLYLTGLIFFLFKRMPLEQVSPLTAYQYWSYYQHNPRVTRTLETSALLALLGAGTPLLWFFRSRPRPLHGKARMANFKDVKKAGLLGDHGIVLGKFQGRFLILQDVIHTIIFAPTGSGKTTGIGIPNLLNWRESIAALDIKGELYQTTAGFRQAHGQAVYCFEPLSRTQHSHRWNPLGYVSRDEIKRVGDLQKVASMIWRSTTGEDGFWDAQSRDIFLAVALYIMETPELPFTLGECVRQVCYPDLGKRFCQLVQNRAEQGNALPAHCIRNFMSFAGMSDRTQSSVLANYKAALELFQLPDIDAATSANDFDLTELRQRRMSLYVAIPPGDLARLAPLVNLFFRQLIDLNTEQLREHNPALKHTVLLVLDEFASLGRIEAIAKGISYLRGYGLYLLTILQSPSQLQEAYGEHTAKNLVTNHLYRVVFGTSEEDHARQISETLGYATVKNASLSRSLGFSRFNRSETISDQRRALLLPQEVKNLDKDKLLIISNGMPPVLADKIKYFSEAVFTRRLQPAPQAPKFSVNLAPNALPDWPPESETIYQPVTLEDVAQSNELDLSDLKYDFSGIIPPKGKATQQEIDTLVEQFFQVIEGQ